MTSVRNANDAFGRHLDQRPDSATWVPVAVLAAPVEADVVDALPRVALAGEEVHPAIAARPTPPNAARILRRLTRSCMKPSDVPRRTRYGVRIESFGPAAVSAQGDNRAPAVRAEERDGQTRVSGAAKGPDVRPRVAVAVAVALKGTSSSQVMTVDGGGALAVIGPPESAGSGPVAGSGPGGQNRRRAPPGNDPVADASDPLDGHSDGVAGPQRRRVLAATPAPQFGQASAVAAGS